MSKHIAFILIILLVLSEAKRELHMQLMGLDCDSRERNSLPTFTCQLLKIGNKTVGFSQAYIAKEIKKLEIRTVAGVFKENASRPLQLVNVRIDACKFLNAAYNSVVFKQALAIIKKYMNTLPKCPIKAHTNITVSNFYMEHNDLVAFIPEGLYNIDFYAYYRNKEWFYILLKFKISSTQS